MKERFAVIVERIAAGGDYSGWYDAGLYVVLWAIEVGSGDQLTMKEFDSLARDAEGAVYRLYKKIGLSGKYGDGKSVSIMSVRGKVAACSKVAVGVGDARWPETQRLLAEAGVKEGKP